MAESEDINSVLVDSVRSSATSATDTYDIDEPPKDEQAATQRRLRIDNLLVNFRKQLQERSAYHLGYPFNLELDVGPVIQFQNFHVNNIGDPFMESNYGIHSRKFEVAVLDWFANFWELPKDQSWGYVTSGGTEGNLHGLLVGRELFPDGIIYASKDSHYSVFKAAKMYRAQCIKISTSIYGEMNYDDFSYKLLQNSGRPAIVNVNIGTTMRGGVDDVDEVIRTLKTCGFDSRFYIHCDGALGGLMLPFIKQEPKLTFKKSIGSISVSGHKLLGCPTPCGVVVNRLKDINLVMSTNIEYVASRDATITGSRNGHAPIIMWYTLKCLGYNGIRMKVTTCIRKAEYLEFLLKKKGVSTLLNPGSSTVIFERPKDEVFVRKWQLACEGNLAHVVVMPNVSIRHLFRFVDELAENRYIMLHDKEISTPCVAADIGPGNCMCNLHGSARSRL
ncbi:serine decarboxylase 2-like [Oryza brachyantha]|uniref:serine decarboxylase 2-like n=1 Tax=Oryza brachyantha TaxID=4533 RepID=UPI0003EAC18F|nr:serine decarboxylase 2-like [Oryza brachyantha]